MEDTFSKRDNDVDYDVIIVGGGISGIAAARHLLSNGLKKILILEAQNYLGGRIKTIQTEYGHIDLGAEWIHGQTDNPLYELAVSRDLIHRLPDNTYISPSSASIYDVHEFRTETGELVDAEIVKNVSRVMENLYGQTVSNSQRKSGEFRTKTGSVNNVKANPNKTVMNSMAEHFSDGFHRHFSDLDKAKDNITEISLYKWRLKWEVGDNGCTSLEDVAYPGRYRVCDGHGISDLKRGFRSVFNIMENDIPKHCIRLNSPVKKLNWGKFSSSIICSNDDSHLTAKHVIVTIPIGYLQKHMTSMFSPALPNIKAKAIENTGYSNLVKLFIAWDKPFWNEQFCGVQFVWTNSSVTEDIRKNMTSEYVETLKKDENPWYFDITGFERCVGRPNVLCGWLVGEGSILSNNLSDKEVLSKCTNLLRLFLKDVDIPDPDNFYRSDWGNNKYICGGYSYLSVRAEDGDFEALCESLPSNENPRVLFGGEATSYNFYSTTHGAYQSGIRCAQNIINYMQ